MTDEEFKEAITRAGYDSDEINFDALKKQMRKEQIRRADEHKLRRAINRSKKLTNTERARRTHQLCNVGGAALMYFPRLVDFTQDELEDWFSFIYFETDAKRDYQLILKRKEKEKNENG